MRKLADEIERELLGNFYKLGGLSIEDAIKLSDESGLISYLYAYNLTDAIHAACYNGLEQMATVNFIHPTEKFAVISYIDAGMVYTIVPSPVIEGFRKIEEGFRKKMIGWNINGLFSLVQPDSQ